MRAPPRAEGYRLTATARRELFEIFDYLTRANPSAAQRAHRAIYDAFAALSRQPGMGHSRTDLTDRPLRFWSVMGRYSIVYRDSPSPIQIVRVFGPGRDVAALLR